MSDDEEVYSGEEESEAEEESREATPERDEPEPAPADSGPSEAELAMQRRRQAQSADFGSLDEEAKELLESNLEERSKMEDEISELRSRRERRKKEREEEEKVVSKRRVEEEQRRKAEEEERTAKKQAEETARREARASKMAEFEKYKNPSASPNFVIAKKSGDTGPVAEGGEAATEKKSKEQLEAEKRAILDQRTPKLDIDGADTAKLSVKAKEYHSLIMRLESEKYDLEKRFKAQQYDMMELSERARQMNKVGKGGTLKRINMGDEEDEMASRHAGCPSKVVMYSEFERQTDKRTYDARAVLYTGANYKFPATRIKPSRVVKFDDSTGLPNYEFLPGQEPPPEEPQEEE